MRLLWIDAETLGLDPARDALLELSVAEAELESPFDHGPIRHWVIEWRGRTESLSPAVRAMHSESGLFGECAVSSLSAGDVEEVLLSVVPEVDAYEDRPTLAGSSVHFDHGFLAAKMPRLASRLSHRHYDVSAVKLFCRSLGMPKLPRAEAHRASADLVESVEHARLCAEWLEGMGAMEEKPPEFVARWRERWEEVASGARPAVSTHTWLRTKRLSAGERSR